MADDDETKVITYAKKVGRVANAQVPSWVWGALISAAIGLGGWAHGRLWGHEQRLTAIENNRYTNKDANDLKDSFTAEMQGVRKELSDLKSEVAKMNGMLSVKNKDRP